MMRFAHARERSVALEACRIGRLVHPGRRVDLQIIVLDLHVGLVACAAVSKMGREKQAHRQHAIIRNNLRPQALESQTMTVIQKFGTAARRTQAGTVDALGRHELLAAVEALVAAPIADARRAGLVLEVELARDVVLVGALRAEEVSAQTALSRRGEMCKQRKTRKGRRGERQKHACSGSAGSTKRAGQVETHIVLMARFERFAAVVAILRVASSTKTKDAAKVHI
jgi:hypothetical protein